MAGRDEFGAERVRHDAVLSCLVCGAHRMFPFESTLSSLGVSGRLRCTPTQASIKSKSLARPSPGLLLHGQTAPTARGPVLRFAISFS